jgi:hypothetical protein
VYEVIHRRTRYLCALLFSLAMSGCSPKVSLEQVYGTYVASYPFGTDTLTLNRDGTFVQRIEITGEEPLTASGRWSFDSEASYAQLQGFIMVDDGSGHLNHNWRTPKSDLVLLDVEMHWFRIVMESAAEHPYVKQ